MNARRVWPLTYSVRRLHEIAPPKKPGVRRGIICAGCGEDHWKPRADQRGHWRCWTCQRKWHLKDYRNRDPAYSLWRGAQKRAKDKKQSFTINVDDVRAVWPKNGKCPVLGVRLVQGKGKSGPNSATLDRLNNNWGYEPGNIAVISMTANTAKGALSAKELAKVAKWMRANGLE